MMKTLLHKLAPRFVFDIYHLAWAHGSALWYGNPSKKLVVIGLTGTKGKSTTAELVRTMLAGTGHKVAMASTVRFMVGDVVERNLFKMSMPGRGYLQQFLRQALDAGCTHAVMEMTSEGTLEFRHKGIELNALIFTNLAPEHIERHGSFEAYVAAKLSLAEHLSRSGKRPRIIVANIDDTYGKDFLAVGADIRAPFGLADAEPYTADDKSVRFLWKGVLFSIPLPGLFNLKNCLAALTLGQALGLSSEKMKQALEHVAPVAGRVQRIEQGQPFAVVVDYAHTPDSLKALYEAYKNKRIIAVIGSTGGGRDTWNRPLKGAVTEEYADMTYVTNEDPYDEDPQAILESVATGFTKRNPKLILDRRAAIAAAIGDAKDADDAVLITGKGTDPYIMGPRGTKEVWSDAQVAQEELIKLGYN
ncbi:MAG TPA: UDP-N-acetylmuramyl-tripeptide synthetase [Candidatus Paceibacterota bacterium]|jgi:UDP-N-acetylmuramoyl-L-alanyl-D-glutamate--2,6-diaminopimelate ligase|nr:UDP-N-acetylmuramyl-tripeptide synthetase [Candidatus Paceibacterota bacterium]